MTNEDVMPRILETTVFQFDELSERAKERAREWFRTASADDSFWHECVIDDAKECLRLAGFTVDKVYFSGFWSQGDGACFVGSWYARDTQPVKAMRAHAPKDKELRRIAAEMRAIARLRPDAGMLVDHSGRYSHEHCTSFSVDCESPLYQDGKRRSKEQWAAIDARDAAIEERIIECSRDAMRWIYRALKREWEYQNADAQVDENIRANEYEFTEEGTCA